MGKDGPTGPKGSKGTKGDKGEQGIPGTCTCSDGIHSQGERDARVVVIGSDYQIKHDDRDRYLLPQKYQESLLFANWEMMDQYLE